jgi:hypothetical protein
MWVHFLVALESRLNGNAVGTPTVLHPSGLDRLASGTSGGNSTAKRFDRSFNELMVLPLKQWWSHWRSLSLFGVGGGSAGGNAVFGPSRLRLPPLADALRQPAVVVFVQERKNAAAAATATAAQQLLPSASTLMACPPVEAVVDSNRIRISSGFIASPANVSLQQKICSSCR